MREILISFRKQNLPFRIFQYGKADNILLSDQKRLSYGAVMAVAFSVTWVCANARPCITVPVFIEISV
jgi:hypothetical protein